MKVLLTGRNGQVGWELERLLPSIGDVVPTDRNAIDLANPDSIRRVVREVRPQVIVNAAAYTTVDRAESEPELAMRVNGSAPGVLAEEARRLGALLVHYSTDYVFDGTKGAPYVETDAVGPINAYGRTKLAGEEAIRAAGGRYLILRTAWVYGMRGRNFLQAILQRARKGEPLRVVDDQFGAPTWSRTIAEVTVSVLDRGPEGSGLYHLTAKGETSWFGFARELLALAGVAAPLTAIPSSEYPTAAARPRYSVLDSGKLERAFGISLPTWESGLLACLKSESAE